MTSITPVGHIHMASAMHDQSLYFAIGILAVHLSLSYIEFQ